MTPLDHIVSSLRSAATYNQHDTAAPSVVLWTDGQRLWERVAARVGDCFGRFYILGAEADGKRTGPATWIRYHLAADESKPGTPIIYLPGVSRQAFRSAAGFPEELRHLFPLQFLGQFWSQLNGKDWTPTALLSSDDGGLGLDMAKDNATQRALSTQLAGVLETPVDQFRGKRLEAADFNNLSAGDPAGMLLRWISDPETVQAEWPAERMAAFHDICQQQYGFNPQAEGRIGAAEKLVEGGGAWEQVWLRFEEAPATYRAVSNALAMVTPNDLFGTSARLPKKNLAEEVELRRALCGLGNRSQHEVLSQLLTLAAAHRQRASSVWAHLGEAPLAQAVTHLGRMAALIEKGISGADWDALANWYVETGWQVDAEARRSFAAARQKDDLEAVAAALRGAYLPWLEQCAAKLSAQAASYPNHSQSTARTLTADPGIVYLFVDGLRTDVAQELIALLDGHGFNIKTSRAWSPLPSVTATAKPGWHPLASHLSGDSLSEKFEPQLAGDGKPLTTEAFRKRITALGFNWFPAAEFGDPSTSGWSEAADFDSRGHEEGAKLAWRIQEELQVVRHRINELLQAGWKKVMVITDHGWLWLPGGLPKTDLPTHLTASKWGRCAVPQPGAQHTLPTAPWFWAPHHHVVLAPGVTAFRNSVEYAHGGLTLQETLTLAIEVTDPRPARVAQIEIASARWQGLRLKVEVKGASSDYAIDVRTKAADPSSSCLGSHSAPVALGADGKASLIITNDDYAGAAASLVLIHHDDVVAKQAVTIGENPF